SRVRGDELPEGVGPRLAPLRLRAHERHRRPDDPRRAGDVRVRRRGRAGRAAAGRGGGRPARVPDLARDGRAPRRRRRRLDARRRVGADAARPDDEPAPRARLGLARRADLRGRRRRLPPDEPQLVDRRQAAQLPVRHADRLGDQEGQARTHAPRRDVHRRHSRLLGLARAGRRARGVAHARPDQLREGPARPERARLARRLAGPLPRRPDRREGVSAPEIAERALAHAGGHDAEVFVAVERSGFARFAASEVHQPTLIENVSVQLRLVDEKRAGVATTNRTDDGGLAELARRAADVLASATDDPDLPPLTPPAPMPDVAGFDEETAELGAGEQSKLAAAAIGASNGFPLYGYFTSGVVEEAIASTTGLRATQRATDSTCLALAAADGASGYAIGTSWRVGELEPAAVAEEAAAKAARTRDAAVAEPARYRA